VLSLLIALHPSGVDPIDSVASSCVVLTFVTFDFLGLLVLILPIALRRSCLIALDRPCVC